MNTLDYDKLAESIIPDTKKISYQDNKHLFTKVAFDVFQLNDSPVESYWILETGDDGKEYLVAKYEDSAEDADLEARGSWQALADKEGKNVTVFYKGVPIRRLASAEFGFSAEDVQLFNSALVSKLAAEESFVSKMMNSLPLEKRAALKEQFPELPAKK